jgi:hypothetical protein
MSSSELTADELNSLFELVGQIYECAVEPERWQPTIDLIKSFMDGVNASMYGFDLADNSIRFFISTGIEPEWLARMPDYVEDVGKLFAAAGDVVTRPIEQFGEVLQLLENGLGVHRR